MSPGDHKPAVDPVDQAIETLKATPIAEIQRRGWHFQARDFYSPLNDLEFLDANRDLWRERPMPRGIDWDPDAEMQTLRRIAPYANELVDVAMDAPPGPHRFHWQNDFWTGIDALVQYCLMREVKPRRVVEIGCGWSSLLLAQALAKNEGDDGERVTVDQIEPYPRRALLEALPAHWKLHETILQRAPLEAFEALEDGDVCFYDGSHVAKAGSDVVWFFSEVLPRLNPGVVVHVHDIFWPHDYPVEWVLERGQTWNEQYVLQAFLMFNSEWKPLLGTHSVMAHDRPHVDELFGSVTPVTGGGSFWMRRLPA